MLESDLLGRISYLPSYTVIHMIRIACIMGRDTFCRKVVITYSVNQDKEPPTLYPLSNKTVTYLESHKENLKTKLDP